MLTSCKDMADLLGVTMPPKLERLGRYRAWVTDPRRAVVLEFPDRTIVVSPGRPHLFVDELRERTGVEATVEAEEA